MEHVEIVDRWEVGDPTPVSPDAKIRASKRGKLSSPFHTVVYVDDHGLIRAQQSDEDKSALVVSASLASDYVRLFGPGEPGETPILAPKKSSNWNTTLEFLGFVINSHTLEISVTIKKAQAIQTALVDDWPRCRRRATAQEVFRIAGKLWNLTYVIRAGKYFVWRLLRITDLTHANRKKTEPLCRARKRVPRRSRCLEVGNRPRTYHGRGVTGRPMFRRDQAPTKKILPVRCKLRRDRRFLSKTQNLLEIRLTPRTFGRTKT